MTRRCRHYWKRQLTQAQAEARAEYMRKHGIDWGSWSTLAYYCQGCGSWHVGRDAEKARAIGLVPPMEERQRAERIAAATPQERLKLAIEELKGSNHAGDCGTGHIERRRGSPQG